MIYFLYTIVHGMKAQMQIRLFNSQRQLEHLTAPVQSKYKGLSNDRTLINAC